MKKTIQTISIQAWTVLSEITSEIKKLK